MARRRLRRWWSTLGALILVLVAVEYGVVPALVSARRELSVVHELSWSLLAPGLALEVASLAAYTCLTQVLVGPGRTLRFGTQWRIDLTGYGLSHVVPGGGATSSALRARLMIERGVPAPSALALTAVQIVWSALGLLAVWLLGVVMALPRTGVTATSVVLLGLAGVAVGALALVRAAPGDRSRRLSTRVGVAVLRRFPARWREAVAAAVRRALHVLRDPGTSRVALVWAVVNWLVDALCLWVCLVAYGEHLPVELVLAAYGLANAVGMLPLTPGGLGIVEGVLVPALVAAGSAAGPAVFGVLTWRLLQYWLPIPVATVCWATLSAPARR